MSIDGYSQPGSAVNTLSQGTNAKPLIEIDGANAVGAPVDGLVVNATGVSIDGLVLENFKNAIVLSSTASAQITGNFIGVGPAGTTAKSNQVGILVGSTGNMIGGPNLGDRNLISGNTTAGILGGGISPFNLGMTVTNNLIGTDATGMVALGNQIGIEENQALAGQVTISGNVISGNLGDGIALNSASGSLTHLIQGNLIGTTADGQSALGNGGNGITDLHGSSDSIGGTSASDRNVISGNGGYGIELGDTSSATVHDVVVQGNYVGTDGLGSTALGNSLGGISAAGYNLTIGGSQPGSGNVISGNEGDGVILQGQNASGLVTYGIAIEANTIGVDASGLFALGNQGAGDSPERVRFRVLGCREHHRRADDGPGERDRSQRRWRRGGLGRDRPGNPGQFHR